MDEVENFFANFQILGPLGCQRWVVIPQNVKKVKITAPYSVVNQENVYVMSEYILQHQYVDLDLRTFLRPLEPIVKDDLHTKAGNVEVLNSN